MKSRLVSWAAKLLVLVLAPGFLLLWTNRNTVSSSEEQLQGRSISIKDTYISNLSSVSTPNQKLVVRGNTASNGNAISNNQTLPSFDGGGVIIFWHIPKTGGTTIRKTYQGRKDVTYLFSNRLPKYDILSKKVDDWVVNGPQDNAIGILEIHARNNPTLLELCDQLRQWRDTAKRNRIPFFAFTVFRDPISFSFSYFNYYHLMRWERRRFEYLSGEQTTEENFRRTMHSNPQCLFLTRSEQAYQRNFPEKRLNLTKEECDEAYQCLRVNMDWIGTTDRLHETFSILQRLIINDENGRQNEHGHSRLSERHENTGPKIFGPANISSAALQYLKNMTQWDEKIYQTVRKDYSLRDFDIVST